MSELEIKRQATEMLHKGRFADAIAEYEKLISQQKKPNPAILNLIGDLHVKQGSQAEGFDYYVQASRAYSNEGLFHNGIAVGKKVLRLDPDQVEVYGMLGQLYARQGLGMDCIKFLNEYTRRKEAAGEFPAALASFAEVCETLADFPDVHAIYGEMLEQVDRKEDAAVAFERASAAYAERQLEVEAAQWQRRAAAARGETPGPGEATDIRELMSLRSLDSSPEIARPSVEISEPWAQFNPQTNPDIPPPPPLPPPAAAPEPPLAEPEPVPPVASGDGLELESMAEAIHELEIPAAPSQPAAPEPDGLVLEGLDEPAAPEMPLIEAAGPVEAAAPEPVAREPIEEPAAPEAEAPLEGEGEQHAVVVGDDFELVREGGDVQELINDFREATTELLDLDDHQAHYDLGTTYMEMELFEEAAAEFEIAARGHAFVLASQEMLGYCFLRNGQIDLAILELRKGLDVKGYDDRDKLGLLYNLGVASRVLDKEDDAIEYFRRILEIDPDFRDARVRLERLVENSA